jgi:O-antigen/teichoic acid export membrane protein
MTVLAIAQVVFGIGLGPALVQRQTNIKEAADVSFWTSLGLSLVLYGGLVIASGSVAHFYRMPAVAGAILVAGAALPLTALGSTHLALLQKELKFRAIFWATAPAPIAASVVALIIGYWTRSFWALIVNQVVAAFVTSVLAWRLCSWRPRFSFYPRIAKSLLGFGGWVVAANFVGWGYAQADNVICGRRLGNEALGIYALGFSLSGLLPGLIIGPFAAVAFSLFCEKATDPIALGKEMLRMQRLLAAAICPVALGTAVLAVPVVTAVYGNRWPGLGYVLAALSIFPGLSHIWSLNAEALRSCGRPDLWPKTGLLVIGMMILGLWYVAPMGLAKFSITRATFAALHSFLVMWLSARTLGLRWRHQVRTVIYPMASALVMVAICQAALSLFRHLDTRLALAIPTSVILGGASYLVLLRNLDHETWHEFWGLLEDLWGGSSHIHGG